MKLFGRPLQFSLASALLMMCFAGAVMAVFINSSRWRQSRIFPCPDKVATFSLSSDDKTLALAIRSEVCSTGMDESASNRIQVMQFETEEKIFELTAREDLRHLQVNSKHAVLMTDAFSGYVRQWKYPEGKELPHSMLLADSAWFIDDDHLLTSDNGKLELRLYGQNDIHRTDPDKKDRYGSQFINHSRTNSFVVTTTNAIISDFQNNPAKTVVLSVLNSETLDSVKRIHLANMDADVADVTGLPGDKLVAVSTRNGDILLIDIDADKYRWRVRLTEKWLSVNPFPEGDRMAVSNPVSIYILDVRDGSTLATIRPPPGDADFGTPPPLHILRNGDIVALSGGKIVVFSRRFPEWWWGHFYRVETWLAIVLGFMLLWRFGRWILRKPKSTA